MHASAERQSTLQLDPHVTSHVAVSLHVTLLLAPTVASQSPSMHVTFELLSAEITQREPARQVVLQLVPQP